MSFAKADRGLTPTKKVRTQGPQGTEKKKKIK